MLPAHIPVVTIDGPSGAGKGTIASILANELKWHLLDSGAIYRVLALAAAHHGLSMDDEEGLVPLASGLDVEFRVQAESDVIVLEGEDVTKTIRTELVGKNASICAALPRVREALLRRQRSFASPPGLVADGRDMGTVVFPNAVAKIFLTASAEARANRRYQQLKLAGHDVMLSRLLSDIKARDQRDTSRASAPLSPANDAYVIDSTEKTIDEVVAEVKDVIEQKLMAEY